MCRHRRTPRRPLSRPPVQSYWCLGPWTACTALLVCPVSSYSGLPPGSLLNPELPMGIEQAACQLLDETKPARLDRKHACPGNRWVNTTIAGVANGRVCPVRPSLPGSRMSLQPSRAGRNRRRPCCCRTTKVCPDRPAGHMLPTSSTWRLRCPCSSWRCPSANGPTSCTSLW